MLVVRESSARVNATTERWALVVRYIQDHFRHNITALEVAGVVGLEPHYFSNQFRRVFGRRFTDHIHELRLEYATQLLVTTDSTVEYIAKDAGFQSSNHFYTIFKRSYRTSPLAYRKQHTMP
jgi:AraC-like DNA-binding protein